jgi:flagellar motor switch protein FliN
MSHLGPESLAEVLSACTASLEPAAQALERTLGGQCTLSIAASGPLEPARLLNEVDCAGLAIVLTVGAEALLAVLPESSGLLPEWCLAPEADQTRMLAELARELGSLWLPPTATLEGFVAAYVPSLAEAILRGQLASGAMHICLQAASATGQQGELFLLWPAAHPDAVLDTSLPVFVPTARPAAANVQAAAVAPRALPSYVKSLLNIRVPVTVTLASQRLPLGRIIELGPGSLLQFDKSCEERLELEVNGRRVAVGEAVKVGDKFGIRVSAMILPEERFIPIGSRP